MPDSNNTSSDGRDKSSGFNGRLTDSLVENEKLDQETDKPARSQVEVRAVDREEALQRAAEILKQAPKHLTVLSRRPVEDDELACLFVVGMCDRDAVIDLEVAPNGLTVTVAAIEPAIGSGRPHSAELIHELLKRDGVTCGVKEEAIAQLLEYYDRTGRCTPAIHIAEGDPPVEGKPGSIELVNQGNGRALFSGDTFARLIPTIQPGAGRDVKGEVLPPFDDLREIEMVPGVNCRLSSDKVEAIAEIYGEPVVQKSTVFVRQGIRVIDGGLRCAMDFFPIRISGEPVTEKDLLTALRASHIDPNLIDRKAVASALEEAKSSGEPVRDRIVANGIEPEPGRDGAIEFTVDIEERVGTVDEMGRVDFKERNRLHRVVVDDQIARIRPHTAGKPGIGVTGDEVPAPSGKPVPIEVGKGVRLQGNGLYATRDGVLIVKDRFIQVSNAYRVNGDVDYHSGNIVNDSGSVFVDGSLLAGFRLSATEDVQIAGSVDGGDLVADQKIVVKGAVIGKGGSRVRSGGDMRARRAQMAQIHCNGDLTLEKEAYHCQLQVSGLLKMSGHPGAIIGGEVEADGGIIAGVLGSASGVPTPVACGRGTRRINELKAALEQKREPLQQLEVHLGDDADQELISRLEELIEQTEEQLRDEAHPEGRQKLERLREKKKSVIRLLRLRGELEAECGELESEIENLEKRRQNQIEDGAPVFVTVRGPVYPGVEITIEGAVFEVSERLFAVRFYYNPLKGRVEVRRH